MENVIELETQRQNRDLKETNAAPNRDVLESMYEGVAMSKWGSLENLAKHVADIDPRFYLSLIAKCIEPPTDK